MPTLDVSDAFDLNFMDTISVIRRTETINQHGRTVITETPISADAVVAPIGPDDLQRLPESDWFNKAIQIITPFRLQGVSKDELGNITHPDHVLWHGSVYEIRTLDDYSGYGAGFVSATAVSITPVDPPPIPAPIGSA